MKIKKFFQNCFKKFFQILFNLIYGKIKQYDPNKNIDFIKKKEVEKIKLKNQEFKVENSVYEISNSRVYTDLVEHVAIIKENIILPDISYQQISGELKNSKFNKVLTTGTPRIIKKFNGSILSLVQGASGNNFFHFLFDIVAKLKLCEEKIPLNKIDYFYLPGSAEWQKKIISVFGISEKKLIDSQKYRHIKADRIIALDHPWYKQGFVQDEINNLPEWIIYFLREKFLNYSKEFKANEKIFIDRSDSNYNHCKLINNKEIIDFLSKKGFKSYQVSKLDFFEQIYLFNNAKIIIGPHGAAFSNVVFSNPGLNLIELIPENHLSIKCEKISKILSFNYKRVKLKKKQNLNKEPGDMHIENSKLEEIINLYN
jgi:capsular polysaccharide biosynthesis protein